VPVGEIPDLIAAADVGLSASTQALAMRYIVPAKVDEYLEVGRPVVASRLPGMLEELADQPSIIWIDGPSAALDAIAAVVAGRPDPRAYLRELGAAAREYGRGRESWSVVTSRFRAVLEEARVSADARRSADARASAGRPT
jgi:glycosyltransferase involved in cell wall biosynthesis